MIGLLTMKLNPFLDRIPTHPGNAIGLRLRDGTDQDQCNDHSQIGDRIDVIDRFLPAERDHKAGQCGTNDRTRLPGNGGHAEGVGQVFCRDQIRDERLARRAVKGNGNRLERGQGVDQPDRNLSKLGQQSQSERQQRSSRLGDEQDLPAVERIGDHAADQRKNDDRQNARQPYPTERNRLIRQGADMPEQRPDLHLRPRDGKQLSEPEVEKAAIF